MKQHARSQRNYAKQQKATVNTLEPCTFWPLEAGLFHAENTSTCLAQKNNSNRQNRNDNKYNPALRRTVFKFNPGEIPQSSISMSNSFKSSTDFFRVESMCEMPPSQTPCLYPWDCLRLHLNGTFERFSTPWRTFSTFRRQTMQVFLQNRRRGLCVSQPEREGTACLHTRSLPRELFIFSPGWRADGQEFHRSSTVSVPDAAGWKMQNPWL